MKIYSENGQNIKKISYSFGMVDLLHYGHIRVLKQAAKDADLCIFGLVGDQASDAWFGPHVSNENERKEVLNGIKYIDKVMSQVTFDPIDNLTFLHEQYPNAKITLFHGNDWKVIPAQRYLESIGGQIVTFDYYDRLSPQRILETLNKSEFSGRPYSNPISTKANTLIALKDLLQLSTIEDIFIFTVGEFKLSAIKIVLEIQSKFQGKRIVIRSSSKKEDAFESSNAGHFSSILNINSCDTNSIHTACQNVIDSYDLDNTADNSDQVLVQCQTMDVLISGVLFTRDIQRNRPYYVIDYDESGSTDFVTSGKGGKEIWLLHDIEESNIPVKWKSLINAVREIEEILSDMLLDIEFAITRSNKIVIFQVRPLAAGYKFNRKSKTKELLFARENNINYYQKLSSDKDLSFFSDMAFWNPSEIIGDNPKHLDYSLYQKIITEKAWNIGLITLGYCKIEDDLMYKFGNKPYISLDHAFISLTPSSLKSDLKNKLSQYYRKKLLNDLTSHDKIEFEIVLNCFDFSIDTKLEDLYHHGFSDIEIQEIRFELYKLTKEIICNYQDLLKEDVENLNMLESIRLDIQNIVKNCTDFHLLSKTINTLLEAIVLYGTPQFSRHARCAFIAKSFCSSLVQKEYITQKQHDAFMTSIETVATKFEKDFKNFSSGKLSKKEFLSIYGHLRAGTYDIRCKRYDQMPFLFRKVDNSNIDSLNMISHINDNVDSALFYNSIDKALNHYGFEDITPEIFVSFLKDSIEQREFFKFIFTKSLSYTIEIIKKMGSLIEIPSSDLSYLSIPEILSAEYYSDKESLKNFWQFIIDKRKKEYQDNSELILPSVITKSSDFDYIENINARPNFITEKKIMADRIILDGDEIENINGKIVLIERADPGFDWIFTKGICGLITKYGGAASHMAIRCAEFAIPAAIGCGDRIYNYAKNVSKITLDCKNEQIIAVYD